MTSSILQYNPELEWLFDKSQDFEGNIKKFDNAEITLDDLINGTHLEDRSVIPSCVFSISSYWYCPNGHSSPDDLGGNCGGEWVIDLNTGPCPPNTGGGGGSSGGGNGDGGTGGGGSSGSTHTVILEICDGFSLPGEGGNSEDCEDDYAAYFIPYICNSYQNITFINNWALNNQEDAVELASYLANNFTEYDTNNCADFDFETLITLTDQLENNPYLLLDIDCTQIANWQTLAQHTAPYGVQIKIDNLPSNIFNDFYIQSLEDAGGTIVNMDYFSVKVTSLPTNPDTGQQFTADGLLDYFRRNINSFVEDTTFEPYCEIQSICQQETDLWNSNDPLGSLIYIDIPGDDGTVICTEFENDYWYFMTMNAPHSGNHPVAGTRQFGYEQNNDGSYNFFVRGVDRFDSNMVENVLYALSLGNPFFGADDLWESFQTKMNEFVNVTGASTIVPPIKDNRPDWEEIKDVLNGEIPISELGCN